MEIKKENLLTAYNGANAEQKQLLETLFGADTFRPKDVTERIKTFEDACRELGKEHPFVQQYDMIERAYRGESHTADFVAYLKIRIITAALNEGWEPQFTENEWRYYPWLYLSQSEIDEMNEEKKRRCDLRSGSISVAHSSLAYANAYSASSYSVMYYGARLAFKSEELAAYAGRQFVEIYADFYFIPDAKAGSAEM